MNPIQLAKDQAVTNAIAFVRPQFWDQTKAALLGEEDQLLALLKVLPGNPVCAHNGYMKISNTYYKCRKCNC
jgi:hypothetical protein